MAKIATNPEGSNSNQNLYTSLYGPPALALRPRRRDRCGELIEDDEPVRHAPKDPEKRRAYLKAYTLTLLNLDHFDSIMDGIEDGMADAKILWGEGAL